jgi:hypothetical protein
VPVTVSGAMDAQTEPFRLDGGRYIAAWSVEPEPATRSCIGNLTLKSPDDPRFQQSIVSGLDAQISASGTTQVEGPQAGRYYAWMRPRTVQPGQSRWRQRDAISRDLIQR